MKEISLCVSGCLKVQYYVSLTRDAFKDYICGSICSVNDYYALHLPHLDRNGYPFSSTVPHKTVHESDEKLLCVSTEKQLLISSTVEDAPSNNKLETVFTESEKSDGSV